jgi:hypothetical protein
MTPDLERPGGMVEFEGVLGGISAIMTDKQPAFSEIKTL